MRRQYLIILAASIVALPGERITAADVAVGTLPGDPATTVAVLRGDLPIGWDDAATSLERMGGSWFVPDDRSERDLVSMLAASIGPWECVGPWIGASRDGARSPIDVGWIDAADGAAVSSPPWSDDSPAGAASLRWAVAIDGRDDELLNWINLIPGAEAGPGSFGLVASFPADLPDCDADGIPDVVEVQWLDTDPCDTTEPCPGDLNGDGTVGGADIGAWLVYAGDVCDPGEPCPGDLDGDGEITGGDLGVLLVNWGPCPE